MNSNIINPISLPIYYKIIEESIYLKIKEDVNNFIKNKKELLVQPKGWQCNTLSTIDVPFLDNINSINLNQTIKSSVGEYYNVWGFKEPLKLSPERIWVNLSPPGAYQEIHNHFTALFSGVLYIETDKNSGDICFLNPLGSESILMGDPKNFNSDIRISPQNGLMLIFPGWLNHQVFPNNTNKNRISISFNIHKI